MSHAVAHERYKILLRIWNVKEKAWDLVVFINAAILIKWA